MTQHSFLALGDPLHLRRGWTPLLCDADADVAVAVVTRLLAELRRRTTIEIASPLPLSNFAELGGLALGAAGRALALATVAEITKDDSYGIVTLAIMERATTFLTETSSGPGFFEGFSGVAWASGQVNALLDLGVGTDTSEIDHALCRVLDNDPRLLPFDLVSGLAGVGLYALSGSGEATCELLDRLIEELARRAEPHAEGVCWRTPPENLTLERRARFPNGCVDLGVAHGVPGVIAFLSQLHSGACLNGATGSCLALLTALGGAAPTWDAMFGVAASGRSQSEHATE